MLSYGILSRPDLVALRTPSMAGVFQSIVGTRGALFISIGLIISVLGAYLSWSLLAAEVLFSAAKTGTMPSFLAHENQHAVPSSELWLTNVAVQAFLVLTLFAEYAFTFVLKLTSSMILIPYLLVAAYALKLVSTGETYASAPAGRFADFMRSIIATIYAIGLIFAGGLKFLLLSAIIYAPGTFLFYLARRENNQVIFTAPERLLFVLAAIAAAIGIYGVFAGDITL